MSTTAFPEEMTVEIATAVRRELLRLARAEDNVAACEAVPNRQEAM